MGIESNLDTPLAAAVRKAGSQSAYARLTGRSQSTVYEALKKGREMWAEDALIVERELGIPKEYSRPDLYPLGAAEADNQPIGARADGRRPDTDPVNLLP